MSDQLTQIDEATLDPKVVEFFTNKYAPVIAKKAELEGKIGAIKPLQNEVEALGGLEALKALRAAADKATADADAARLAALAKDGDKAALEEHYKKLLAERDDKISKRDQRLVDKEVEAQLTAAISAADGSAKLLTPHMRSRIEAKLDANGDVVIVAKGSAGQTLDSISDLVTEFKASPDFAAAFKAHAASGGGGKQGAGAEGANNPFAKASRNVTKQMELIKNQPDIARKMAQAAGEPADW